MKAHYIGDSYYIGTRAMLRLFAGHPDERTRQRDMLAVRVSRKIQWSARFGVSGRVDVKSLATGGPSVTVMRVWAPLPGHPVTVGTVTYSMNQNLFGSQPQFLRMTVDSVVGRELEEVEALRSRPLTEWHEDLGSVLWWRFPVEEPPYVGCPLSSDWPFDEDSDIGWTPLPDVPPRPLEDN